MRAQVACGEFIRSGDMVSIGRNGLAYRAVVWHKAPWWARGPLLRWWRHRQPILAGFAKRDAKDGEHVTILTTGTIRG